MMLFVGVSKTTQPPLHYVSQCIMGKLCGSVRCCGALWECLRALDLLHCVTLYSCLKIPKIVQYVVNNVWFETERLPGARVT